MPNLFLADMVREMSSSTGTGAFSLDGPTPGHRSFAAAIPSGATFPYAICGVSDESQWETGEGTLSPAGTLLRSPKDSSAGGGLVDFGAGLKTVALTLTADWAGDVQAEASAPVTIGAIDGLSAALSGKLASSGAARASAAASGDRLLGMASGGATIDLPADAFIRRLESGPYHAAAPLGVGTTAPASDLHIVNASGPIVTLSSVSNAADHVAAIHYRNRQNASGQSAAGQIGAHIKLLRQGSGPVYRIVFGTTNSTSGDAVDRWYMAESGHFRPNGDALYNIGQASERVNTIFASSGTINTSDAALKADMGAIPDAWLDAWGRVEWSRFRFKGGARWHVGLIAQAVEAAFAAHGVDAFEIGLLCRDEVEGEARYGLRYDECFALEAAWTRRELAGLQARKSDRRRRRHDA